MSHFIVNVCIKYIVARVMKCIARYFSRGFCEHIKNYDYFGSNYLIFPSDSMGPLTLPHPTCLLFEPYNKHNNDIEIVSSLPFFIKE
jgi:hypothetical protein